MRILIFLLIFLVSLTNLYAQTEKTGESEQVNQVITRFFDGIAALDMNQMKQFVTTDFLLLESGDVWNLDTLAVHMNQLKTGSFSRTNRLNFIRTEIKENIAWVAYDNAADMIIKGQKRNARWLESAVLIKEGKEWKIQMLHSTPTQAKK